MKQAIAAGMADAWTIFADVKQKEVDTGKITAADVFGSRDDLKNNYLYRCSVPCSASTAIRRKRRSIQPTSSMRAARRSTAPNRYTLRFAPGQLPPVDAFWSITMYEYPAIYLVKNPIDRYLINSPDVDVQTHIDSHRAFKFCVRL